MEKKQRKRKPKLDITDTSSKAFKSWMISMLRKASYRWPARNQALKNSKIGCNQYVCATCKGIFAYGKVKKDHINPVVEVSRGFVSWDVYITRMFVPLAGWQILCEPCHSIKSMLEREERKKYKE